MAGAVEAAGEATGRALEAVARLYHATFTGLILTVVSRRSGADAAEWMFRLFRHQHHEKFLSSFDKLGLRGLPDAVACAAYHYLSNQMGGVRVEFMRESDAKAWVHFVPPRWVYPGAAICGVPSEVSRAMLAGWYAQNGVSLGNPRLGFVVTAQTTDGQHGLAGYFWERGHEIAPEERLIFRPGELAPPFDAAAAPRLSDAVWPAERLAKARRNYAMEYIRSGLPRLVELLGPAEGARLGRVAGQLVGAQAYQETAELLGIADTSATAFGELMVRLAAGEGDAARCLAEGAGVAVERASWRLMRGLGPQSPAVHEAWCGLLEGLLAVHNRFLVLDVPVRPEGGSEASVYRVRRRGGATA